MNCGICISYKAFSKLRKTFKPFRVRATDRHCRQMRRKNIFGTKKYDLAKTSGEKKNIPIKKLPPKYHPSINCSALNTCQTITLIPQFTFRCFSLSVASISNQLCNQSLQSSRTHCLHSLPKGNWPSWSDLVCWQGWRYYFWRGNNWKTISLLILIRIRYCPVHQIYLSWLSFWFWCTNVSC